MWNYEIITYAHDEGGRRVRKTRDYEIGSQIFYVVGTGFGLLT